MTLSTSLKRVALALAGVGAILGGTAHLALAAGDGNMSRPGPRLVAPAAASIRGFFAVVNENGSFARGKGVVSTRRLFTGQYEVLFNASIAACAFGGTVGGTAFVGSSAPGEITVQGRISTNNGLYIETKTSAGVAADRSFHVVVTC
jgi:hypothetical protein